MTQAQQKTTLRWYSGNYGVEFQVELRDAKNASHSGHCDDDIEALSREPYIASQLAKIDPETLKRELADYAAWDEKELADHKQNLQRILWLACGDISDRWE